jgi:hypothetical protein
VEHLAGTGARTVLRVRRNALGVLPILTNTSANSLSQRELAEDVDNYFVTSSAFSAIPDQDAAETPRAERFVSGRGRGVGASVRSSA